MSNTPNNEPSEIMSGDFMFSGAVSCVTTGGHKAVAALMDIPNMASNLTVSNVAETAAAMTGQANSHSQGQSR